MILAMMAPAKYAVYPQKPKDSASDKEEVPEIPPSDRPARRTIHLRTRPRVEPTKKEINVALEVK